MPHFYTTYYLAPKESKNIDGPILFASPNDVSKNFRPKIKSAQNIQKH